MAPNTLVSFEVGSFPGKGNVFAASPFLNPVSSRQPPNKKKTALAFNPLPTHAALQGRDAVPSSINHPKV
jgi:hypothetical protein